MWLQVNHTMVYTNRCGPLEPDFGFHQPGNCRDGLNRPDSGYINRSLVNVNHSLDYVDHDLVDTRKVWSTSTRVQSPVYKNQALVLLLLLFHFLA